MKIRLGHFKGYRGRVVDATDSTVRIELESQMKVVTGALPFEILGVLIGFSVSTPWLLIC